MGSLNATALSLARVLWERAHLSGWGYGKSIHNDHTPPSFERCLDDCICLDGSLSCDQPSCLLEVVESAAPYYHSQIVRRPPPATSNSPSSSAAAASSSSSAVRHQLLLPSSKAVDPAGSVHCYCPYSTSNATLLSPIASLHRFNTSKAWQRGDAYYRCHHGAALQIPSSSMPSSSSRSARVWPLGCGDSGRSGGGGVLGASAAAAGRTTTRTAALKITRALACTPERYLFSTLASEVPIGGFDSKSLGEIRGRMRGAPLAIGPDDSSTSSSTSSASALNKEEVVAQAEALLVLPTTPSMLYNSGYWCRGRTKSTGAGGAAASAHAYSATRCEEGESE